MNKTHKGSFPLEEKLYSSTCAFAYTFSKIIMANEIIMIHQISSNFGLRPKTQVHQQGGTRPGPARPNPAQLMPQTTFSSGRPTVRTAGRRTEMLQIRLRKGSPADGGGGDGGVPGPPRPCRPPRRPAIPPTSRREGPLLSPLRLPHHHLRPPRKNSPFIYYLLFRLFSTL